MEINWIILFGWGNPSVCHKNPHKATYFSP
uniref:Uncharacterized protein n=1 Tax=Anguilla anguilla TaxID=7936 RepID=A0A0E9TKG4_ANGAN